MYEIKIIDKMETQGQFGLKKRVSNHFQRLFYTRKNRYQKNVQKGTGYITGTSLRLMRWISSGLSARAWGHHLNFSHMVGPLSGKALYETIQRGKLVMENWAIGLANWVKGLVFLKEGVEPN